jgi:hypothetical protein
MTTKKSIYIAPPLTKLLKNRPQSESLPGRVDQIFERYTSVLDGEAIELTDSETHILGNCLMGSLVSPLLIRHLVDELDDSEFADQPDDAFRSLREKLVVATDPQLVATVEQLGF